MADETPSLNEAKQMEEIVLNTLEAWSEKLHAIAFVQLLALGMNREKAHKIKKQLGLSE